MGGGGVTPANVGDLLRSTGISEVHASAKLEVPQDADLVEWGFTTPHVYATSRDTIRALREAMRSAHLVSE